MEHTVNMQNTPAIYSLDINETTGIDGFVVRDTGNALSGGVEYQGSDLSEVENSLPSLNINELKKDQLRAFEIVAWHLDQTLQEKEPPVLRLLIHGEGCTGKSQVIQTITNYFEHKGYKHALLKAAYTGVAASLIEGKTTHTIGMISVNNSGCSPSDKTKAKLQNFWKPIKYLIIDECSMLAQIFLAQLSGQITIGKASNQLNTDLSFGRVNVILCGDFHQFPPVAGGKRVPLYCPYDAQKDRAEEKMGRQIYEEFCTVVELTEQVQVTDDVWIDFLRALRYNRTEEKHLKMLHEQVMSEKMYPSMDLNATPWKDACLVTPCHCVREAWNAAAARKHCEESGQRLFICTAEDRVSNSKREMDNKEKYAFYQRRSKSGRNRRGRQELPDTLELAIGMKVMVTSNIETDLDITNHARGKVVDIVLHKDEPFYGDQAIVNLKYLPAYILVKMDRTHMSQLDGLEPDVIPVEVRVQTFRVSIKSEGKSISRTIKRRQFPITAAYAFTDYRAQGQTIPYVIVDIGKPPSGSNLSLFNLYVALSRSSGRKSIRLLRDFDDVIFKGGHEIDLLREDDRLKELNNETKVWWGKVSQHRKEN